MANPKIVMKKALDSDNDYDNSPPSEPFICELISKAFTTRNLLHFAHWNTKSFSQHMALGDLYDDIISDIDDIVESYQGKNGLIDDLCTDEAELTPDIVKRVKDEAKWVEDSRSAISGGDPTIESLIDILVAHYYRTIYKLENLA
jgi:hypothetical protein